MKLGYVITRADILGGAHVHVRDVAAAMQDRGHEVAVFAGSPGVFSHQLRRMGIRYVEIPELEREIMPFQDVSAFARLRSEFRDFGPDLVSTHCSKAGMLGRLAAKTLRLPVLFTAHGWSFGEGVPEHRRRLYRWLERSAAPISDRIIAVCDGDRQIAVQERVASGDKLRLVHNGMPDVELRARPDAKPVRMIMVARACEQKDYLTLVRALAEVRDLEWHLDQVGDGPLLEDIQSAAHDLGLADRITFLGLREDVVPLLAQSHVYLLITNWEGFPRSILEAMRAGLPVVASDVGGVREAVRDGKTGFLIGRSDVSGLAARLRQIIESPSLRLAFGNAGRERYAAQFTFERMLDQTLEVYQELLGSKV